ncbi:MAG: FKBP-type peptidyl-prolyl cis-trans isomerase [Tannerella sp.]|jgi:FKBP-type peptidyl-prolyl cis-trans isomerase SlyD|nr:FKBP-type peptidyl-prolyl cis-trans isomerase [Tannerella sp.]
MNITANKFVSVSYDLNVGEGEDRELMEQATAERPLKFIYGLGAMLPAFESRLSGLAKGETFRFSLSPENAYGEYEEGNLLELPKNVFEVDGRFDDAFISEGNTVPMMTADGQQLNGSVLEVRGDTVLMDFNHPLAGETLHFDGKVLDVHEATAGEIAELSTSVHGGCGCHCNCDDNCCNDDSCCGSEQKCGCGC